MNNCGYVLKFILKESVMDNMKLLSLIVAGLNDRVKRQSIANVTTKS